MLRIISRVEKLPEFMLYDLPLWYNAPIKGNMLGQVKLAIYTGDDEPPTYEEIRFTVYSDKQFGVVSSILHGRALTIDELNSKLWRAAKYCAWIDQETIKELANMLRMVKQKEG